MSFLSYFLGNRKKSAVVAKERLQIILAHERGGSGGAPDYLPALKEELLAVIEKYVDIKRDQIKMSLETHDDFEVLELNITLPELQRKRVTGSRI